MKKFLLLLLSAAVLHGQDAEPYFGFPEVDFAHPGYVRVSPDYPRKVLTEAPQAPPLLGGSFLRHFIYEIDPQAGLLTLSRISK